MSVKSERISSASRFRACAIRLQSLCTVQRCTRTSDYRLASAFSSPGARRLRCICDGIKTKGDATREPVLALGRKRMELRPVRVTQQALKPRLAVKSDAARRLQRLLNGRQHLLGNDRLAHHNCIRHLEAHYEVEIVGEANHVVHGELHGCQMVCELAEKIQHSRIALAL